jgi:transketolase
MAGLRAMPNILNFRPADGNEVSGAYHQAFLHTSSPSVIVLTRQNLPNLEGSSIEAVAKGAYRISGSKTPSVLIAATGSEVQAAVGAVKILMDKGIEAGVVSMPSWELFEQQKTEYRDSVFPEGVPVLGVEVYSTLGWARYAHGCIGMSTFGASAPAKDLFTKFGFNPDQIAGKAEKLIAYYKGVKCEWKMRDPLA